jgi:hypothetical protein
MIGAIVLATEQGLGYLAKDFYDNGVIDKVFVQPHGSRKSHYEWYDNRVDKVEDLLDCDSILMFETPFDWSIIPKARTKGVKTVLMPMYECTNYPLIYNPDLVITPSDLDLQYYPKSTRINVPVPQYIKWKQREKAKVFVHNAGNGGLGGRNGTKELLEAMKYVKSPIKLIVRSQVPIKQVEDDRIEYTIGTQEDIWSEGDVFIFPEKFNGLSLPIQEAFASGMVVMCGDRFPMNEWLPKEPLIPVASYRKERLMTEFDYAEFSPQEIAKTIDEWYGKDIIELSQKGREWASQNSWDVLKAKYLELCKK